MRRRRAFIQNTVVSLHYITLHYAALHCIASHYVGVFIVRLRSLVSSRHGIYGLALLVMRRGDWIGLYGVVKARRYHLIAALTAGPGRTG